MSASTAQRAEAARKRAQAVSLRMAGVDWATIADRVGYRSPGAACTAVSEALKAAREEQTANAEELSTLIAMRLDRLQAAVWPQAIKGDPRSAEVALKVIDRRIRLEGLDAPMRVSVEAETLGAEILEMISGLTPSGTHACPDS